MFSVRYTQTEAVSKGIRHSRRNREKNSARDRSSRPEFKVNSKAHLHFCKSFFTDYAPGRSTPPRIMNMRRRGGASERDGFHFRVPTRFL